MLIRVVGESSLHDLALQHGNGANRADGRAQHAAHAPLGLNLNLVVYQYKRVCAVVPAACRARSTLYALLLIHIGLHVPNGRMLYLVPVLQLS